jgi:hypothetical protein
MHWEWQSCRSCGAELQVEVFPALLRADKGLDEAEAVLLEGESSCFYHPDKKAVLACEACGRFVCALCDCDLHGQHYCPTCLDVGKTKGKIKNLENYRVLYDTIALALAVLPIVTLVFWFASLLTAPAAIFVAIRYWNAPRSIVHRTKIRYVLAIVFATVELAGWGLLFYSLFGGLRA